MIDGTGQAATVRAWISERAEEMAALLVRLVASETENPPGRNLAECAQILGDEMDKLSLGPEIHQVDSTGTLTDPRLVRGAVGSGEELVYFQGHWYPRIRLRSRPLRGLSRPCGVRRRIRTTPSCRCLRPIRWTAAQMIPGTLAATWPLRGGHPSSERAAVPHTGGSTASPRIGSAATARHRRPCRGTDRSPGGDPTEAAVADRAFVPLVTTDAGSGIGLQAYARGLPLPCVIVARCPMRLGSGLRHCWLVGAVVHVSQLTGVLATTPGAAHTELAARAARMRRRLTRCGERRWLLGKRQSRERTTGDLSAGG